VGKGEPDHVEDDGVHFCMDHIGQSRSVLRSRKPRRWQEERAERFHLVDLISPLSPTPSSIGAQSIHSSSRSPKKLCTAPATRSQSSIGSR